MTTIAYKAGIIAADTGICAGSLLDAHIEKIAKRKDGAIAGGCGEAWWIVAFLEWFKNGGEMPHISGDGVCSTAITIDKRRKVTLYESEKDKTRVYVIKAPYHALGAGRSIALGAMYAGAHPVDAVKAAMTHNDSTFGKVQQFKVGW